MPKKPAPLTPEQFLKLDLIPMSQVDANPWNPNVQADRTFQAVMESILSYGFIDPITVRPHPDEEGRFEIVDGEHRWKAIQTLMDEGCPPGVNDRIKQMVEAGVILAVVEEMPESWAKKYTIIANETRGKADVVQLGELLADLASSFSADDLLKGLPYAPAELEELVKVGEFDWDTFDAGNEEQAKAKEQERDSFTRVRVAMPEAAYEVYQQAYNRLGKDAALHPSPEVAHGQVIEALAAEYLATVGAGEG